MPYICLIRNDVPDGAVYIKSLRSESQRVPAIDPVGQARYVNRVQNDRLYMSAAAVVSQDAYGLSAYLADRLEPGGLQATTGTITSAGPLVGDTLTIGGVVFTAAESIATGTITAAGTHHGDTVSIKGVTFTAIENYAVGTVQCQTVALTDQFTLGGVVFTAAGAAANSALQQFDETAGSDILVAASLALTINDPASQTYTGGVHVVAANGGTDTVTMTAGTRGYAGEQLHMSVTLVAPGTIIPSGPSLVCTPVDPAVQEFAGILQTLGGINTDVAASLATTINDVTPVTGSQALLLAAAPVGVTCAAVPNLAVVTLTASAPGAQGEFALLESTANARIHLSGATMVSVEPHPALQEFASLIEAGSDALVAASIQATVNHANSQALFGALNRGVTVTSGAPAGAVITLTPSVPGQYGAFTLVTSAPARITLSGTHMTRAFENWTAATISGLAAPIIARMDAGLSLTETAINILINAVPGVSGTSISSPGSTTVLADILSILSGRGYYIPAGAAKAINAYTWNTTPAGGFGKPYVKVDSQMLGGELRPFAIGGDPATKEFRPIRHTYMTDELVESMDEGEIAVFLAKAGMPPVSLWPNHSETPQLEWTYQKAFLNPKDQVDNAKIIMVYDDDGSILV